MECVDDPEPFQARKAFLVNGPHTALALKVAVQDPVPQYRRTDTLLRENVEIEQMVRDLQGAGIEALLEAYGSQFDRGELEAFASSTLQRFRNHPDTADRVLDKLYSEDFISFVKGFYTRLVPHGKKRVPEQLEETVNDFLEVLQRRGLGSEFISQFADLIVPRPRDPG